MKFFFLLTLQSLQMEQINSRFAHHPQELLVSLDNSHSMQESDQFPFPPVLLCTKAQKLSGQGSPLGKSIQADQTSLETEDTGPTNLSWYT